MHRYRALLAISLAMCSPAGLGWADEPVQTQLWLRAAVPPQAPKGAFPGVLLRRGDAVMPLGKIECERGSVVAIGFGEENKLQARVPTWLLSATKPSPLPEAGRAANPPRDDRARLKGSWGVVARSLLGTLNPGPEDKINAHAAAEYWFRRKMQALGLGSDKMTIRGYDAVPAYTLQNGFHFDGCVFTDKETAFWHMSASNSDRPLEQGQNYAGTYAFRIDAAATPKRLDFMPRINATRDVLTIYEFDGEFLKIAIAPTGVLMHATAWPPDPTKDPWRRPAGFDAESTRQSIVLWLSRLDEREFPAPPGSLAGMPTLLTAPGAETSERLSEPMKKLLGTWREVVHEQGGSRDYAGLTWNLSPGRATVWYPELPDYQESYAVYPGPGFIVDPTQDPPRLDLVYREPVTKSTWIEPGIYAWDGDRLKWCRSTLSVIIEGRPPAEIDRLRPHTFETAAAAPLDHQVFAILERSQQRLQAPTRRPEASTAHALRQQAYREAVAARTKALEAERLRDQQERQLKFANDTDRLLGTWRVVSDEIDGAKEENEFSTTCWNFSRERVVYWNHEADAFGGFDSDKPVIDDKASNGGQFGPAADTAYSAGKFVLDEKAQPKRLDLASGIDEEASVCPGIYRWDGLRLVWCLESTDGPASEELDIEAWNELPTAKRRPTDFKSAAKGPAAHRRLLVLRRVMEPIKVPEVKELK